MQFFSSTANLAFPPEPSYLFRELISAIHSQILSILLWHIAKNKHLMSGLIYILSCKLHTFKTCVKSCQNSWECVELMIH